ncbi:MAG: aminotransferase class I/II-fold pyridoxal phosphate-dependent enzyme [Bacteroidetes bacterium]|nr:aminotransferase class I/II-fold pyridoxal phosphate-dependent enzyme [Bacteroidota bacterium]
MHFETTAIRTQTDRTQHREHSTPIFPTSSFIFEDAEQMRAMFADELEGNIYSRFTNPSMREFEEKMALLEGVEDAVATASGMAAVFASFLAFLKTGDHLLASKAVFGSSYTIITQYLPKWGISFDWLPTDTSKWQELVKPNTKMLFLETPSNPGLDVIDLAFTGQFCKHNSLIFNIDNCFATPYLQQPVHFGADLITHSATKWIDGQGRVLGGVVAGSKAMIADVKKLCRSTGPSLSPFNAWVLSKSLETLAVRMDRHCENALLLAQFLEQNGQVARVIYPFLDSHPMCTVAKQQMKKGGGIVAFEIKGGLEQGRRFLNAVEMCSLSANLGDTRTIVTHPASTTHAKLTEEARQDVGITNSLVRVSVGLEHIDDIVVDIDNALKMSSLQ